MLCYFKLAGADLSILRLYHKKYPHGSKIGRSYDNKRETEVCAGKYSQNFSNIKKKSLSTEKDHRKCSKIIDAK